MTSEELDRLPFEHHRTRLNGLDYHFVTLGSGPAVLFCHGFPDQWRGWRHQMAAFAEAGFMAIAPDLRGYGETIGPDDIEGYTSIDVVGDLVALLDHLGLTTVTVVGHDWGATVAIAAALIRPDRFTALATLSVPVTPRPPASLPAMLRQHAPPDTYMLYFLEPGVAEQELDSNLREFIRRGIYTSSGKLPGGQAGEMRLAPNGGLIDGLQAPTGEMSWFDDREVEIYTESFRKRGIRQALNTYRSLDRSWRLDAAWADRTIEVPSLYIGADRDIVLQFPGMREAVDRYQDILPNARPPVFIEGAGHFMQMEAPDEVSAHLIAFVRSL